MITKVKNETAHQIPSSEVFEFIDNSELARRWDVTKPWIERHSRGHDPIPSIAFGRFKRYRWQSPELLGWLARRMSGNGSKK